MELMFASCYAIIAIPAVTGIQLLNVDDNLFDTVECSFFAKLKCCLGQCLHTVIVLDILQTGWNIE